MARALFLSLGFLVLAPATSSAQEPLYIIQDLGTFGASSRAHDVNDSGWVVGGSGAGPASLHAFLWLPEPALGLPAGIHDLGTLGNGAASEAMGIDAAGRVVGWSDVSDAPISDRRAFLWALGAMTDLGTSMSIPHSLAVAINSLGDIAGYVEDLGCLPILWLPEARYGLPAGLNVLPTFIGHVDGQARDVNDLGQVTGFVTGACDALGANMHPYLWLPEPAYGLPAGAHDLLAGTNDGYDTRAEAINDLGVIVGHRSQVLGIDEPWIWRDGVFEPLPVPPGSESVRALDVNDLGQLVGSSGNQFLGPLQALIWEDGEVVHLQDLIPPGTDWTLEVATAINERGQIVGYGDNGGETRAFLLTPAGSVLEIPTLGSAGAALLALLLAGVGAALLARRRPVPRSR